MERVRKQEGGFNQMLAYLSSAGLVSAITKTLTAPLERVKLIMQTQNILTLNQSYKFKSYAAYFTRIPSQQGVDSFWRGNMANVYNIIPQAFAQFLFYDNVQRTFFPQGEKIQGEGQYILNKFLSATTCGMLSMLFTYPLDTVRVRMSLEFSKNKEYRTFQSVFQTLSYTRQNQGISQLYRGFLLANLTNIHYFISIYTVLDVLRNAEVKQYLQQSQFNVLHYFGVSQFASNFALLTIYPLDTIRRRMQMNGYNKNPTYSNTLDCFNKIKTQEGALSLYKGCTAAITKNVIGSLISASLLQQMNQHNLYFY